MPYGDLVAARVQRFATRADLDAAGCTAEEREEYERTLAAGNLVSAGVDYAAVLRRAETEADLIVWDGGNNDFPSCVPACTWCSPMPCGRSRSTRTIRAKRRGWPTRWSSTRSTRRRRPRSRRSTARLHAVNPRAPIVRAASPGATGRPAGRARPARAGGRGRADDHPRRHGDRSRPVAALAAARPKSSTRDDSPMDRWPKSTGRIRTSGRCCLRWATAQRAELARCIAGSGGWWSPDARRPRGDAGDRRAGRARVTRSSSVAARVSTRSSAAF